MASEAQLLLAVKDLLQSKGHLNRIQAEVRSKITQALSDKQLTGSESAALNPPAPPSEVVLVNELVREYLVWNGYLYTATLFTSEAGLQQQRRSRAEICTEVGVKDDERSATLPLLNSIVSAYMERIRRKIGRANK